MTDVRVLVQAALDTALNGEVCVFWQRRAEIEDDPNSDEYIVYTIGGDRHSAFADGEPLTSKADATVRYYYKHETIDTPAGRAKVKEREATILTALKNADFSCPSGAFDAGDVDEVGCFTSVIECSYVRVI